MFQPIDNLILIKELYEKLNIRVSDIAYYCNCCPGSVYRRLEGFGIPLQRSKRRKALTRLNFINEEAKYSWIAGVLDGEGCIGIYKQHSYELCYDSDTKKSYYLKKDRYTWQPRAIVANTSLILLLAVFKFFGGTISRSRKENKNSKACYQLTITSFQMRQLLEKCLSFLVIKRRQAKLVLELQERDRRSETVNAKTLRMIDEMKELNHRGVRK